MSVHVPTMSPICEICTGCSDLQLYYYHNGFRHPQKYERISARLSYQIRKASLLDSRNINKKTSLEVSCVMFTNTDRAMTPSYNHKHSQSNDSRLLSLTTYARARYRTYTPLTHKYTHIQTQKLYSYYQKYIWRFSLSEVGAYTGFTLGFYTIPYIISYKKIKARLVDWE